MVTNPNRLDADLYQLKGEEVSLDHIAGSGHLSLAALYANHGSEAVVLGALQPSESVTPLAPPPQSLMPAPSAPRESSARQARQQTDITNEGDTTTISNPPAASNAAANLPGSEPHIDQGGPIAAAALSGAQAASGSNGNNGSNGFGNDGNDGNDGQNGEPCAEECHGGDTTIINIDVTNNQTNHYTTVTELNLVNVDITNIANTTNLIQNSTSNLINVNIGGDTITNNTSNTLIDIAIGGDTILHNHHNQLIDIDIINQPIIGGNDNDHIDLGLLNGSSVGGNDNDLIDLGLLNGGTVGGNDNDLIDLGLNETNSPTGSDNDLIDLDLDLLQSHADSGSSDSDVVDGNLDLLNDGGLANIDLGVLDQPLLDIGLNSANEPTAAPLVLALDTDSSLMGGGTADCGSHDLLLSDLTVDLGIDLTQGALGGLTDALLPDTGHSAGAGSLGLQLGLGAWV